jgi:threonine synthase
MNKLLFYSTNLQAEKVDLKTALMRGQAPDRGLYMPVAFPSFTPEKIASLRELSYPEIAYEVFSAYTEGIIDNKALLELCVDAYDFEVPLEHIHDRVHVMRLDQGPTASFKDFAARMMARLIGRFVKEEGAGMTILTATSGDTGSAVASAFHGLEGIRVLVLFPVDEVSERQRKQMTTLTGNIRTIAVSGKFDDCQALVKQSFSDPELAELSLSSANSINIGRLLPQSVYYFYAASRLAKPNEPIVLATPSGNFGNMMGGVLARKMGLPVYRQVITVNENDEFPVYLDSAEYEKIEPSRCCISNAMNVGHPSNLARLVSVYDGHMDENGTIHKAPDYDAMRRDIFSTSVTDEQTRTAIKSAWEEHHLMLEPHGAVGWQGLHDYIDTEPLDGKPAVVLETAHPAKFPEEIEKLLGIEPETPPSLTKLDELPETFDEMEVSYDSFKNYLVENYS